MKGHYESKRIAQEIGGTRFGSWNPIPVGLQVVCRDRRNSRPSSAPDKTKPISNPLTPPAQGSIPGCVSHFRRRGDHRLLRTLGGVPGVEIHGRKDPAFRLYTVAETKKPIIASGGMKIIPDYTFQTAPAPKLIVIPAQKEQTTRCWNGFARRQRART